MQLGIKIGPDTWKEPLKNTKASLCEIWYRFDWEEKYRDVFDYLKKHDVKTGLHFWGTCKDNIYPSLVTGNEGIRRESIGLMKRVIKIASGNGFNYVNVHPEARRLFKLIFPAGKVLLLNEETKDEEALANLISSGKELTDFADKNKVLLTIETIPRLSSAVFWEDIKGEKPDNLLDLKAVPSSWFTKLGEEKIAINFDIGHTMTETLSTDPQVQIKEVKEKAVKLAPYTKIVHFSSTVPPFNGIDSHNGFTGDDYRKGAIPSLADAEDLLRIFSQNKDVLIVPEPYDKHTENHFILQKIVNRINNGK